MECFKNQGSENEDFGKEERSRWVDAGFCPAYGGQALQKMVSPDLAKIGMVYPDF